MKKREIEHVISENETETLIKQSETAKLKRIFEYWKSVRDHDQTAHRQNFKVYTQELDKRRGTDFKAVFPEYLGWYDAI